MSIINLTPAQLRQAADLKEQIVGLERQLSQLSGTEAVTVAAPATTIAKKGGMSAAGRARIAAAAKLRWAKINAAKSKPIAVVKAVVKAVVAAKPVKKGGMSAAGRARIIAAQKARWSKIKEAKPVVKAPVKAVSPAPQKKGGISAEGRARIAAAAKARWAKAKSAGKKSL
jgi:hypothetical protein